MKFKEKEMKYGSEIKRELLAKGKIRDYKYFILNLGIHPTAYIQLSKSEPFFNYKTIENELFVHGGVSYIAEYLDISADECLDGYFIGWDYGHANDYSGIYEKLGVRNLEKFNLKKWTVNEIKSEIEFACLQLDKIKNGYIRD